MVCLGRGKTRDSTPALFLAVWKKSKVLCKCPASGGTEELEFHTLLCVLGGWSWGRGWSSHGVLS